LRFSPIIDGDCTFVECFVDFDAQLKDAGRWSELLLELIAIWRDSLRRTHAGKR